MPLLPARTAHHTDVLPACRCTRVPLFLAHWTGHTRTEALGARILQTKRAMKSKYASLAQAAPARTATMRSSAFVGTRLASIAKQLAVALPDAVLEATSANSTQHGVFKVRMTAVTVMSTNEARTDINSCWDVDGGGCVGSDPLQPQEHFTGIPRPFNDLTLRQLQQLKEYCG